MNFLIIINFLVIFYNAECALNIPKVKLHDGHEMPLLGLGTWLLTGDTSYHAVKDALEMGYRHIDTADDYNNEKEVGKGINEVLKEGKIKREELFIVTKVSEDNLSRNKTVELVKRSLSNLGLKYLDLELIHWGVKGYLEVWKGLEDAVEQGLVKSIGLSNFNKDMIDLVIKNSKIKPVNLQNQINPEQPSDNLIEYCKEHNISVTAYSPLGHGHMLSNAVIKKIAEHHDKSTAQVLLRFEVQRGVIVIPKASTKAHLIDNTKIFDWKLSDAEMKEIDSIK